ncbi:MAG: ZIP family metal transporter [Oscillospiraceae bacterium]
MNSNYMVLLLSFFVGLSSVIGAFAVFMKKSDTKTMIAASLAFAAGLTATVSLSELLPEAMAALSGSYSPLIAAGITIISLLAGVALGSVMDLIIPHYGCAHGGAEHHHHHEGQKDCDDTSLYHTGIASALGLALHNIPEGGALFIAGSSNISVGIAMGIAIVLHNIPEGIAIAMPIYVATGSKAKAFAYTAAAGLMMPLGGVLAWLVLAPFMESAFIGLLYAFVAGIMLYIALHELLPSSFACNKRKLSLWSVVAGICMVPITQIFHH